MCSPIPYPLLLLLLLLLQGGGGGGEELSRYSSRLLVRRSWVRSTLWPPTPYWLGPDSLVVDEDVKKQKKSSSSTSCSPCSCFSCSCCCCSSSSSSVFNLPLSLTLYRSNLQQWHKLSTSFPPDRDGLRTGHITQNVNKLYISVQLIHLI